MFSRYTITIEKLFIAFGIITGGGITLMFR